MASVLSDPRLYGFVGGSPPTVAELEVRYALWVAGAVDPGEEWHNWVVRDEAGEAVGHAQATVTREGAVADVAWVIGTPWQGRGYASEVAQAVVVWLDRSGVPVITAHVHPDHTASARVAANAGLVRMNAIEGGEVVWRRGP